LKEGEIGGVVNTGRKCACRKVRLEGLWQAYLVIKKIMQKTEKKI